ncbi:MAG: hypothetical protein Q9218_004631 [Villophora microphyllina]
MAEAVAAISLAASIVQLLSFGAEVVGRLQDYRTKVDEVPAAFHDISVQLPLLISDLRITKERAENGELEPDVAESLLTLVKACQSHITSLDEILAKTVPITGESTWKTSKKVILSFRQEEKVRIIADKLRNYVIYLTHHSVTNRVSKDGLRTFLENDETLRMLQWLSDVDPSINHNRALQERQEGSGRWFLESSEFGQWRLSPHSLAWLYGIRGFSVIYFAN